MASSGGFCLLMIASFLVRGKFLCVLNTCGSYHVDLFECFTLVR